MAEKFEQLEKKVDRKLTVAEMYLNRPRKWWIYTLIVLILVVLALQTSGAAWEPLGSDCRAVKCTHMASQCLCLDMTEITFILRTCEAP